MKINEVTKEKSDTDEVAPSTLVENTQTMGDDELTELTDNFSLQNREAVIYC